MKVLKFILNTIFLAVTFVVVSLGSVGVNALVALQTSDSYAQVTLNPTNPEKVSYFDPVIYWGEEIGTNVVKTDIADTKIRVGKWFNWDWWGKSMSKVDQYFVDPIVKIFKPIIMPLAMVDEINNYHDANLGDKYFINTINESNKNIGDFRTMSEEFFDIYYTPHTDFDADGKFIPTVIAEKTDTYLAKYRSFDAVTMAKLSKEHKTYYTMIFKLHKYSDPMYEKWDVKWIKDDRIKVGAYTSYTIFLISVVVSLYIVWQNPVTIKKTDSGSNEVTPMFRRIHIKRRPRKEKKNKKDDE